mgnify:CR=1 FL=1
MTSTAPSVISVGKKLLANMFRKSVIDVIDPDQGESRTATGRLYMWELRQLSTGRWTNAYGLYCDTYVRHDGRWVIGARTYSSLARTADAADGPGGHDYEVFPIPGI